MDNPQLRRILNQYVIDNKVCKDICFNKASITHNQMSCSDIQNRWGDEGVPCYIWQHTKLMNLLTGEEHFPHKD